MLNLSKYFMHSLKLLPFFLFQLQNLILVCSMDKRISFQTKFICITNGKYDYFHISILQFPLLSYIHLSILDRSTNTPYPQHYIYLSNPSISLKESLICYPVQFLFLSHNLILLHQSFSSIK